MMYTKGSHVRCVHFSLDRISCMCVCMFPCGCHMGCSKRRSWDPNQRILGVQVTMRCPEGLAVESISRNNTRLRHSFYTGRGRRQSVKSVENQ